MIPSNLAESEAPTKMARLLPTKSHLIFTAVKLTTIGHLDRHRPRWGWPSTLFFILFSKADRPETTGSASQWERLVCPELILWAMNPEGRVVHPPGLDLFIIPNRAEDMASSPGDLISHCSQRPKPRPSSAPEQGLLKTPWQSVNWEREIQVGTKAQKPEAHI